MGKGLSACKKRLRISPDPPESDDDGPAPRRTARCQERMEARKRGLGRRTHSGLAAVQEGHAWVVYRLFEHVGQDNVISVSTMKNLNAHPAEARKTLHEALALGDQAEGTHPKLTAVHAKLVSEQTAVELEPIEGDGSMSLRKFSCVIWPSIP